MNTPNSFLASRLLAKASTWLLASLALALFPIAAISAEPEPRGSAPTGAIVGRVFNTRSGGYLEKARIRIEGSDLETLTDNFGQYFFPRVPVGQVRVRAFFTGLDDEATVVDIREGQTTEKNFNLGGGGATAEGEPISLSKFVVSSTKDMEGAAIAINEQRFAANIKNVVSANEFGPVSDHGVGEILKFVPGIAIEYNAGNPRGVGLNGVPSDYVPMTVNGFTLASAQNNRPVQRTVDLLLISTNNLSRIEVIYSPTPESPGMALGGSINMVVRNAFERSKPLFTSSVYLFMPDDQKHLNRKPSTRARPTYMTLPGADFSLIMPVNSKFGFTLSGNAQRQYQYTDDSQYTRRGTSASTNGDAFPDPAPTTPYLTSFLIKENPKDSTRYSFGGTLDYKISAHDQVSLTLQFVRVIEFFASSSVSFSINRVQPGEYGTYFAHSAPGQGQLGITSDGPERTTTSLTPTLTYRHDGPIWKAEAGLGYSRSRARQYDLSRGYFNAASAQRTGVTINFDNVGYEKPTTITVTDPTTGAAVDPFNLNSYAITTLNGGEGGEGIAIATLDTQRTAYANIARSFDWSVPVRFKAGLDFRQSTRDNRQRRDSFRYVGADGVLSTTPVTGDDNASIILNDGMSTRPAPFAYPNLPWLSTTKLLDIYHQHPNYFTQNFDADYRADTNFSKYAEELISSAYVLGDVEMMDRRLKLIGGVRAEQTNVKGEGPLTDATRNYQRDASGKVIVDATGRPVPIDTDPFSITKRTLIGRGQHAEKEYLRLFPSLNASYKIRDNLVARGAYFYSVGRPSFNQYAGGITLPDTQLAPSPSNRITVNNAGIKAWKARSAKVTLEYYFQGVGVLSFGAFRRDIENFFGSVEFPVTPDFLALYGLDPTTYGVYNVSTQKNLTTPVRMQGVEFNYKQALTFLPNWARGVQVFANGNQMRTLGELSANFAGFIPRTLNWGASLTREKYSVNASFNYRSRARTSAISGRGIEPGTFGWMSAQQFVDITGDYKLNDKYSVFWTARNVTSEPYDNEFAGPSTPGVARLNDRRQFDSIWTFGIRGTF